MADYYPLIARAVAGLDKNTGENRRALYERARAALVAQLRGVDPPLEESEVTRERLALEESIRKVEAEAARRARSEALAPPPPAPSPPPPEPAPPPPPQHPPAGAAPQRPAPITSPPPPAPPASAPASRPAPSPFNVPQQPLQPGEPRPAPQIPLHIPLQAPLNVPPPVPPAPRFEPRRAPPPSPFNVPQQPQQPGEPRPATQAPLNAPPAAPPPPRFEPRRAPPTAQPQPAPGQPAPPRAPVRPRAPAPAHDLDDMRRDFGVAPAAPQSRTQPQPQPQDPFTDLPAAHDFDRLDEGPQPRIDPRALRRQPREEPQPFNLEPPPEPEPDEEPRKRGRILARRPQADEEADGLGRSYGAIIKTAIAAVLLICLVGFGYWQRSTFVGLYQALRGSPSQTARPAQTPAGSQSQPKISDRIGQPTQQSAGPAVAQRVVLYEEEPSDPQGKRYIGSAIWRTETVSPGPGQPPELAVRADVEIPERRITMKFSIRRNTDPTLPASHTVEIMFNLPPDFAGGGIANVPGILMKQSEQTRGVPLAGLAVKVMTGFFLVGLSSSEAEMQRNIQLLKERAWFDIPVVYGNNRRAILALEKGTPGERAFAEAFATWKQ